ncbi:hypothetical protein EVAR_33269_1 [Eumeta japonica]|uniref:Uncharacterized protein n=1 Tax=Eumeta variegata TaxID=151549 RepID=A0A4C1X2X6_EUMVA|nr:hypothetical protein EVAR_33269_1 [Eumeta japonica]
MVFLKAYFADSLPDLEMYLNALTTDAISTSGTYDYLILTMFVVSIMEIINLVENIYFFVSPIILKVKPLDGGRDLECNRNHNDDRQSDRSIYEMKAFIACPRGRSRGRELVMRR